MTKNLLQARRWSLASPGFMFKASALEADRCMSIEYNNFTHNIFASGHRIIYGLGGKPEVKK
jgi:hypothetical protein